MQPSRMMRDGWRGGPGGVRPGIPFLARFFSKFVLDVMPAALASVIGGFLFTQYQAGHAVAPRLATEQVVPASAEMMAMVRDEHAMMMDYLKTQMAAEKSRLAAQDADSARAVAESRDANAKVAAAVDAQARRLPALFVAAKPPAPHKAPVAVAAAAPRSPLVIAQADPAPDQTAAMAVPSDRLASNPDSLLAKTLDLKDHVVAATRHVVSAIGDVFASVGEKIGAPPPVRQQFSSAS